ncbi:universal stress protein [Streptomyces sp. MMBL 11-3]|uniref:universal stress protein n=1 Tax=Streptomyces sp. MMBL 11-3 TaxID=3382639 RepID=UPI0039B48C1B
MTRQPVIVAGVDGAAHGRAAAVWAAREAGWRELPLRLVRFTPPDTAADTLPAELTRRHPGLDLTTMRSAAHALSALCQDAEMLVLGLPDEEERDGSALAQTARDAAVRTSACPVVLVPDAPPPLRTRPGRPPAQVTVGVDARDPAAAAIDFACGAARLRQARLRVLHAWSLPASAAELPFGIPEEDRATWEDHEVQLLSDAVRPWREKYPDVRIVEDVVLFSPAEALLHNPGDAELVVVGRRSPNGGGPSTTTDPLLRHSRCPVAVVPR